MYSKVRCLNAGSVGMETRAYVHAHMKADHRDPHFL